MMPSILRMYPPPDCEDRGDEGSEDDGDGACADDGDGARAAEGEGACSSPPRGDPSSAATAFDRRCVSDEPGDDRCT